MKNQDISTENGKSGINFQSVGQTIDFLNKKLNINLHEHLENKSLSEEERYLKVRFDILRALLTSWKRGDPAKEFVLPPDFNVDEYLKTAHKSNAYDITANILLSNEEVEKLKKASGKKLIQELGNINEVCGLVIKHQHDISSIAGDMAEYGVDALCGAAGATVSASLIAGKVVTTAITVGFATAGVALIATAISGLVTAFIELSGADKATLGLVINETNHDITVNNWKSGFDGDKSGHLYMCHGKMVEFMEDEGVQVKRMPEAGGAYGGFYLMTKRSGAWIGVECTMKLTVGDNKIDFLSCCPYSQDNRINLKLNSGKNVWSIHDDLYDNGTDKTSVRGGGIKATAKINDKSGSPSYAVLSIEND